ncbi:restriction endonuclease subunit S [Methylotenera versatilis]|uniref:Restriction modification system DNA specificity domain protein n=1 Tax=Methylotenera versatilis (strain 301) TaxID=666681 RepID=D7DJD4_METV0|nr:restriction endonuclease subunit S [Methylotenera versatilis]ADI30169.1 restriction modification system DNA specificity domain protein [Methylotenera versatilis 301]
MKAGWQTEKLGEVCALLNRGISPKYIESSGICVLNQKCIRDHRVSYDQARRHDLAEKSVSENRFIQLGDVLVNSTGTGTLGRVAQVRETPEEPTTVDSHVTIVRPKEGKFYQDFFGYMLILIEEAIKESGEGCGGQTELARSVLAEKFSVSYPISIEQQQRIVAILDQAFEGIAKARANAEQNLQNARALFESHLQSVFTQHGEGWMVTTVGAVCDKVEYGTSSKSKEQGKIPVLRMGNIQNRRFDWDKLVYTDDDNEIEKYLLKHNDVLFNRTNSPELVGKTAIYKSESPAIFAGYLIRIHRKEDLINADYLNYFLNSQIAMDYGKTVAISSVNQANINGKKLKGYPIPVPSLSEQESIVMKMDALKIETQRLEALYQRKIKLLDELKKSLLQQAFAGEL